MFDIKESHTGVFAKWNKNGQTAKTTDWLLLIVCATKCLWCSRKLMRTLVQPKIKQIWGVKTSCLLLKLVVVLWPLNFSPANTILYTLFFFSLTLWSLQAIIPRKRQVADSFMKCACECEHLGALPLTQSRQLQPYSIFSAVLSFVLAHGATKALPGWAVCINHLHHLDVCHRRPLASSNSICVTCVWNSLSIEQLDARPPGMTLLCFLLSSVLFSGRSICTIAPFFRHSLFWGACFCHSQQPDETWVSVSCLWARRSRWCTRSEYCMQKENHIRFELCFFF